MKQSDITLALPIEYRVKEIDSIIDKIERSESKTSSLKDITDLIGLRIILLFRRDVEKVCDVISKQFDVIEKDDKLTIISESQFGYSSVHFLVTVPASWLSVPTLAPFKGLKAEIQVRSMAQHIWAAASHKLQYKNEQSVPIPVRRSIHRVSALLETVDLEFERILDEKNEYRREIEKVAKSPKAPLNVDLLENILDELLPAENKDVEKGELYGDLLQDLIGNGISYSDELIKAIRENLPFVMADEEKNIDEMRKHFNPKRTSKARMDRGVYFTHIGLVRGVISKAVGHNWADYIKKQGNGKS